jgi:hypothetical protein
MKVALHLAVSVIIRQRRVWVCFVHIFNEETMFVHGLGDGVVTASCNRLLQDCDDALTEIRRQDLGDMAGCACITRREDTVAVATTGFIDSKLLRGWAL